ncbi:MAG: hypothetical protein HOZ81_07065 [Streptomyces sp.]|nr:hypothetical protein [Streptomyces sp.]
MAVTLTKRRRGKANSRATVHWSVDEERELRTMGGFYLLLRRMMRRSRAFSGTGSVWSIWAGNGRGGVRNATTGGHVGPFDAELARKLKLGVWAERHGLVPRFDMASPPFTGPSVAIGNMLGRYSSPSWAADGAPSMVWVNALRVHVMVCRGRGHLPVGAGVTAWGKVKSCWGSQVALTCCILG